ADVDSFFSRLQKTGVKTVICTDISRDGAMKGTNLGLYRDLSKRYSLDLIASGGVSSLEDVKELRKMDIYGAIIGKAYYTGAIDLKEALEAAL
ncbi:MAG: 1-(5-phosphoribosyl)-5-((5-phosphoribosylamino)methylideneamino)imidazole-4-carboxamide isomerase, partial [Erysipelotrichaceae bacterium]|nr:1-(5-phosphoribosyl)-5-((5-phosphoribosylamino)methylideneamino)imidazole-4-carboxamide isomerase [Erysipelotrichaceae bacterium]